MTTSYPLHKIRVVLAEGVHARGEAALREAGYAVEARPGALTREELLEIAPEVSMLGIRSKTTLDAEFFRRAGKLWAVGCFCIGTNQVDLAAAAAHGVAVFNAPFSNTRSVAEMTIAEIIALHRGLADHSAEMHRGEWRKTASGRGEVRGRNLGIVGYGRIGSQVSVLAEAMGMRVAYFDVADRLPMGNAEATRTLEDLLAWADVVTLHVPATAATEKMLGAAQMARMRRGAYLINNARGTVVDVAALAAALREKRLGGAAIDVFPEEPEANGPGFESALRGLANVILTPHIGGSTAEAQERIALEVSGKLAKHMNTGATASAVNVPEVELPVLDASRRRILHFHRNVPGVLGRLHGLIAELGVNVDAEALQTDAKHGYVVLDVSAEPAGAAEALKEGLRRIPETIRVRTLW